MCVEIEGKYTLGFWSHRVAESDVFLHSSPYAGKVGGQQDGSRPSSRATYTFVLLSLSIIGREERPKRNRCVVKVHS